MHGLHIATISWPYNIMSSYLRELPHNQKKKKKKQLQYNEIQNIQIMRFPRTSQLISTCSMSTIETQEKGVTCAQI